MKETPLPPRSEITPDVRVHGGRGARLRAWRIAEIWAVCALLLTPLSPASAQEPGNPTRGRLSAASLCADCHWTEPGPGYSPVPAAFPFSAVAKTKGMTATALHVWLLSSHPTMPNLILAPETADDIIAYILSLQIRTRPPEPRGN